MKSMKWNTREEAIDHALQKRENAVNAYDAGERDGIVVEFTDALALLEQAAGPFHKETVLCIRYICVIHSNDTAIDKQAEAIRSFLSRNQDHACDKESWTVVDQLTAELAESYRLLGDFDQALEIWNDCIEAQESRGEAGVAALAHTLTEAGSCCLWQGDSVTALEYLDRALQLLVGPEASAEDRLLALDRSAYAHSSLGHFNEAIERADEGVALAMKTSGLNSPDLSVANRRKADVLADMGRLEEAVKILEESAKFDRLTLGMDHNNSITSSSRLASAYEALGRHSDSIELYEECLERVRELRPFAYQEIGSYLNNLANNYEKLDMFDKAISFYKEDLEISLEILGAHHPDTITSMINLAEMYSGLGHFSDAEPLLSTGLEAAQSLPRDIGRASVAFALKCNAFQYTRLGDYRSGMESLRQALAISKEKVGREHLEVAYTRAGIAEILRRMGDYEKASKHAEKMLRSFEAAFGKNHHRTVRASALKARLMVDAGRYEEAIEMFERVISATEESQGRRSCVGEQYLKMALAYEGLGVYEKARSLIVEGISLWEPLGESYVHRYHAEAVLGRIHFKDGNLAEASQLLRGAISYMSQRVPNHPWLGYALMTQAQVNLCYDEFATAHQQLEQAHRLMAAQLLDTHPDVVKASRLLSDVNERLLANTTIRE